MEANIGPKRYVSLVLSSTNSFCIPTEKVRTIISSIQLFLSGNTSQLDSLLPAHQRPQEQPPDEQVEDIGIFFWNIWVPLQITAR
jgi:hypothetical protein